MADKTSVPEVVGPPRRPKMPLVYCAKPTLGADTFFSRAGFELTADPEFADWIVLCGGEDVNPKHYHEKPNDYVTHWSDERDAREIALVMKYKYEKTFIGICRGAQLLTILAGGSLWQHVDKHAGSTHKIKFVHGSETYDGVVNTVHHQMMRPPRGAMLIGWAEQSTERWDAHGPKKREANQVDPEIVWYPKDKFFCFQGHPEFGHDQTSDIFLRTLFDHVKV